MKSTALYGAVLFGHACGVKVDGPSGRGRGRGWDRDGCIPVGVCAFGAEGRMASIGPSAFGAKGCVRSRSGGDSASGAEGCGIALRAMNLYAARGGSKIIQPPWRAREMRPLWWLALPPCPRKRWDYGRLLFETCGMLPGIHSAPVRGGKGTGFVGKRSDPKIQ